jgi:Bacterial HORMA domain family 1
MSTLTHTYTHTTVDVAKVVDRFTADFHMIAQATGAAGRQRALGVGHDVKLMAQRGYIDRIDIVLRDAASREVRAVKYVTSTDASLWSSDRPGNNLWPRQVGGSLHVVVGYTATWLALTAEQRRAFHGQECHRPWGPSDIDTKYPGMTGRFDRRYASGGYGMERTIYEGA